MSHILHVNVEEPMLEILIPPLLIWLQDRGRFRSYSTGGEILWKKIYPLPKHWSLG